MYRTDKTPTLNDKYLYHFTTAENLIKILEGMTLKLSTFENLNDLNEKEVNFILQDWRKGIEIRGYIVEHCHLISFTKNYLNTSYCEYGFNHPRMWAQYADNNKGACVVINENKFIDINKTILNNIFWKIMDVTYKPVIINRTPANSVDPKSFLINNYKKMFFEKHNDWKQEDERRLLYIGKPEFLSIDNCIEFICLGNKFESENYSKLSDTLISSVERNYTKLTPHDFTIQSNAYGRCSVLDYASKIIDSVRNKGRNANKYLSYLNKNGYTVQLVD